MDKEMRKKVTVNDSFQRRYVYYRTEAAGKNFAKEFQPELSPRQMLRLGVFGGKYLNDCQKEFPKSWFQGAKLADVHTSQCNFYGVDASQPLRVWQEKGWIHPDDPRGWFQWYCRYYSGRRVPEEDKRQIQRWKAIRRHVGQIRLHCARRDLGCRRKQRQALLHWAYDSRKI